MPGQESYLAQFYLKINGRSAPKTLLDQIVEVVVEDNLYLPDMFVIRLHDHNMTLANDNLLAIGQVVEIAAQAPQPVSRQLGPKTTLIEGEITGLEPDIAAQGVPTLTVRGYDRAYRLHQGRRTRSFLRSTDHEIVKRIATEVKLKPDGIQLTRTVHEHIVQNNQTDMEFLLERAQRLGYDLYVEGETLYFGPPQPNGTPPQLSWGKNLLSFRPCLSVVHQVDEVVVRSWDPLAKREIIARATNTDSTPQVEGRAKAEQRFKGANMIVVSQPVSSQAEADTLAQGLRNEIGGQLIQAEGVCLGNPQLGAGKAVEIEGLGDLFDGQYFITEATHAFRADEAYQTRFTIGGREPQTLTALLNRTGHHYDPGRGVVVGLVTNNRDPQGLGRIKVKYPGLDDLDESPWVRIAAPMAGQGRGFYTLPEINDEVLIAFEQGDIHRPYMLGMLWNGLDKPPQPNNEAVGGDGRVNRRLIRSRSGHEIILDDKQGQETIIIKDQAGNTITMSQDSLSIKAVGDLEIKAGGKLTLKGDTIDLN